MEYRRSVHVSEHILKVGLDSVVVENAEVDVRHYDGFWQLLKIKETLLSRAWILRC